MSRSDLTIAALLFGLAVAYFSFSFDRSLELADEGLILFHSARVAAGEVPYEAFPDTYGPGVFAATGLVLRAFDGQIVPVRVLLAGWKALAVALTFLISRPLTGRGFAVFGALLSITFWGRPAWNLNTPYAALYSIPLCLLACFALIRAFRVDSKRGYFVAGLIGGLPILFKQTIGVMNALAMVLAVSAMTSLGGAPAERSRAGAVQFLTAWLLGGLAILLPGVQLLHATDYVLHFLPLHVAMGVLAAAVVVRGGAPLIPAMRRRFVPLLAGIALLPGLLVGFYAARGSLPALAFNAVRLPATIINYYQPFPLPPFGRCLVLLGVVGLVSAGLLALRDRAQQAIRVELCALVVLLGAAAVHGHDALSVIKGPFERQEIDSYWPWMLRSLPDMVESAVPAFVVLAAAGMLAAPLLAAGREIPASLLQVVVPLVLLQAALIFQVFPRGSFNLWLIQGALMPLVTILVGAWYRLGAGPTSSGARKTAAAALVWAVPLWLCSPAPQQMIEKLTAPRARELEIPQARGIALTEWDAEVISVFDVEQLVAFLRTAAPAGAPLLPITTDLTVLYLSGRRHVFPEFDYYFYLLGLNMLPVAQRRELADAPLGCRLADAPDTLVLLRLHPDDTLGRMLSTVPKVRDVVTQDYESIYTVGAYEVLRRKADAQYPSSCAIRSR